ncbi:MAG: prepilin-type N-terminal cleavage/methylation domain-containing protein, partial [Planctomycetota bacterium]
MKTSKIHPGRPQAVGLRVGAQPRAGFTLIEVLAVIVIIAVLAVFLIPSLLSGGDAVNASATRTFLGQLTTEVESYERDNGKFPASSFPKDMDPKPSDVNMGIEALVIALMPADGSYSMSAQVDDRLCNTDSDNTKRSLTRFTSADAFELKDSWENPIVYLHRRDYEKGCAYLTYSADENDWLEEKVTAAVNPATGDPYRLDSFQLLSAGPDGA